MNARPLLLLLLHCSFVGMGTCAAGDNGVSANFNLRRSCGDWQAGFADYPPGQEDFFELGWRCDQAPTNANRGLLLTGRNHSDDLFMFIKRPLDGLKPLTTYQIKANVQFLSRAPTGCIGIGGDPGASVHVKFGASDVEPVPVIVNDRYRMNVDIGRQSQGGTNAVVLGNIATTITNCHNEVFEAKVVKSPSPLLMRSDAQGRLWVFVGTDSGFEGRTIVIYTKVRLHLKER
jgi:hypothetical protein